MSASYGYPLEELKSINFDTGRTVQANTSFIAEAKMYNEYCNGMFRGFQKTSLGQNVQVKVAHYYRSQGLVDFTPTSLNSINSQAARVITVPVRLGEFTRHMQIETSNITKATYYDSRPDYLNAIFLDINQGGVGDLGNRLDDYIQGVFRNSNQIYLANVDRVNNVATPYMQQNDALIAQNSNLAPDKFNTMQLGVLLKAAREVIGSNIKRDPLDFASVLSSKTWSIMSSNQSNFFIPDLTMFTYEESNPENRFATLNGEFFSLAQAPVMMNKFAVTNPNWVMNEIVIPNSGIPTSNVAFAVTAMSYDAQNNLTATITATSAALTANSVLAAGDVFYFKNQNFRSFIRASTSPNTSATTDLTLVLANPPGYIEGKTSTYFYSGTLAGNTVTFNVRLVGQYRPFVTINGMEAGYNNDENMNLVLDFPTMPTPTQVDTATFADLVDPTGGKNQLIPLCGLRQHCCFFRTATHYEFSTRLRFHDMGMMLSNDTAINNTYMNFQNFLGDPKVMADQELTALNLSYQAHWKEAGGVRYASLMNVAISHTSYFENYNLNSAAIALNPAFTY